jgi:hypothetical protein
MASLLDFMVVAFRQENLSLRIQRSPENRQGTYFHRYGEIGHTHANSIPQV